DGEYVAGWVRRSRKADIEAIDVNRGRLSGYHHGVDERTRWSDGGDRFNSTRAQVDAHDAVGTQESARDEGVHGVRHWIELDVSDGGVHRGDADHRVALAVDREDLEHHREVRGWGRSDDGYPQDEDAVSGGVAREVG